MQALSFLKAEYKFQFPSSFAIVGYVVGILLHLVAYYFTAKAFVPSPAIANTFLSIGYFEFIIIGELCLVISQVSIGEGQDAFFRMKNSGVLEQLYFSRMGIFKSLLSVYYSLVFFKLLFIIASLFLAILFFDLSFDLSMAFNFFLFQLISSIFFIGLYFLNLSISMVIGRRNASTHHIVYLLGFFSGAYFPIEIFTSEALRNILYRSPFALQVKLMRNLVYNGNLGTMSDFIYSLGWSIVPFILAVIIYKIAAKKYVGRLLC